MNANKLTAKLNMSDIKSYIFVGAALIAATAAVVMGITQMRQMTLLTQQVVTLTESIPPKQSAEDMQESLVHALNKLAADKAALELQAKLEKYSGAVDTVPSGKHLYGALDARFTLVEFSDMECPFCKRLHDTPKEIADASKGNVNWQWMHMPLDFHNPAAKVEAHAAECVAEQKGNRAFWAFLDDIFVHSRGDGKGVSDLTALATGMGTDESEFRSCMKEGRFNTKIEEHLQKARQQGITGTPATFVVDNQTGKTQLVPGAQPAQAFLAAISKLKTEGDALQEEGGMSKSAAN